MIYSSIFSNADALVGSEIYTIGRCERFNCPCLRDIA